MQRIDRIKYMAGTFLDKQGPVGRAGGGLLLLLLLLYLLSSVIGS